MAEQIFKPKATEVVVYWVAGVVVVEALGGVAIDVGVALGSPATLVALTMTVLVALATLRVVSRVSSTRLIVRDTEVVIENPFRSVVIPRAGMRPLCASPGGKWIVAHDENGELVPIWAISSGMVWSTKKRTRRWNGVLRLEE